MRVAFIGLGHMGAPMSRNILAAGHDLVVHDLRRAVRSITPGLYVTPTPVTPSSTATPPSLAAPQE
jgi:3-hydroxyisobutyrate dehydrogenase